MRLLLALAALILPACHSASASTSEAPGHTVWRDSTGANVPALDAGRFFDAQGYVWTLSAGGEGTGVQLFAGVTYYASSDCTGAAYVKYEYPSGFPRQVLRYVGEPAYYAFPDAPNVMALAAQSIRGQICEPTNEALSAVDLRSLVHIDKPAVPPGIPPYHPEYIY